MISSKVTSLFELPIYINDTSMLLQKQKNVLIKSNINNPSIVSSYIHSISVILY